MLFCGTINFNHIDCNLKKYEGRSETARHHHSCSYLDKEDVEPNDKDNSKLNKKEDKKMSSDKEPLSSTTDKCCIKHKSPPRNVNFIDGYNNLEVVSSEGIFPFCFITSSPVAMQHA